MGRPFFSFLFPLGGDKYGTAVALVLGKEWISSQTGRLDRDARDVESEGNE